MINEQHAWEILDRYVADCLQIDSCTLLAVYAIGSLGGGYYRPGQSDIDAVLIVQDGSDHIWGTGEELSAPLEALNGRYKEQYQVPKDFGAFPLQEQELIPPYGPEVPSEVARLKLQGKCVYGDYDLAVVPMPTAEDFLQEVQHFEMWWRDEFAKSMPPDRMSPAACTNVILMHLGRYLRIKRDVVEFDKRRLIPVYLKHAPPFVDNEAFRLAEAVLALQELSQAELTRLREGMSDLRARMNAHLGVWQ